MSNKNLIPNSNPRVIYVSGPMKGYKESNYPLFNEVSKRLRSEGHRVYNPAEFGAALCFDEFQLRVAFAAFCNFICLEADTIYMLPGHEKSVGAGVELALANNFALDVIEHQ